MIFRQVVEVVLWVGGTEAEDEDDAHRRDALGDKKADLMEIFHTFRDNIIKNRYPVTDDHCAEC
jgi:hypothetical protein